MLVDDRLCSIHPPPIQNPSPPAMQTMEHETASSSWLLRTHFSRSVCYRPADTSLILSSSNSNDLTGAASGNGLPTADRTHPSSSSGSDIVGHSRRRAAAIFHIEPVACASSSYHHHQQPSPPSSQRESPFASLPASPSPPLDNAAPSTFASFGCSTNVKDLRASTSPDSKLSASALCPLSPPPSGSHHHFGNSNIPSSSGVAGAAAAAAVAATHYSMSQLGSGNSSPRLRLRSMLKSLSHPPTRSSSYSSLNEHYRIHGNHSSAPLLITTPPATSPRIAFGTGPNSPNRSPLHRERMRSPKLSDLNPVTNAWTAMKPSASVDSCMNNNNKSVAEKSPPSANHRRSRVADANSLSGATLPHVASPAHHRLFRSRHNVDGAEYARLRTVCSDKWLDDLSLLLVGERFASGSHSRLHHGIYKDTPVAVKIIRRPDDDDALAHRIEHLFLQEVTVLSCLDHQNIIQLLAACKKPPVHCVITEYLAGGSVRAFLNKKWQQQQEQQEGDAYNPDLLSEKKVLAMAMDVARGMEYLHSKGIVHRDLKSENLVIAENGCLKIVDFGVSCFEWELCGGARQHDEGGAGGGGDDVGTYRWMAPEMLSHKPHSRKVDVYSFGIVLWELLTMRLPYEGMSPVQAAFSVVHQNRRPPIPTDCPSSLAHLLRRCWSAQPDVRPEFREISKLLNDYDKRLQEVDRR